MAIKEVFDENKILLSRKSVQQEALNWIKQDLDKSQNIKCQRRNTRKYNIYT